MEMIFTRKTMHKNNQKYRFFVIQISLVIIYAVIAPNMSILQPFASNHSAIYNEFPSHSYRQLLCKSADGKAFLVLNKNK